MDYEKNLLEERATAVAAARSILDNAASEKRSLSGEEQASVDAAFADVDAKGKMISDLRAMSARESEVRAALAGHVEARPEVRESAAVVDDAAILRSLAKGEMRSHSFETRSIAKSSTGAPVPTSFYDRVIEVARFVGPMLEVGTTIQTAGGENLQIPRTNAYSTGSVTTEGAGFAASDPTFQAFLTLGAFKESVFFQISTEMIEDSGVDILGYLATNVGQAIGYSANSHLTTGTGSTQPTGIITSAGSGITGGTGVSGGFTYANVVDLVYSTDAAVRRMPGFKIMGATSAIAALRKLTDTVGQPIWQPALVAGEPDRLLGYAVVENPHMAAVGSAAKSLVAGDLGSFLIRQVGGIQLDRSDDYAFGSGLVTFRATMRIDSGLPQSAHVKYFAGNAA